MASGRMFGAVLAPVCRAGARSFAPRRPPGQLGAKHWGLSDRLDNTRGFHRTTFLLGIGQRVKMPSLSPTMTEGTIVKWEKKEGDAVNPGDVVCEIQTDKAVVSLEVDEEGTLAKILVAEGTKDIKVGVTIALMVEAGEDWKSVEMPADEPGDTPSAAVAAPPTGAAQPTEQALPPPPGARNYGPSVALLLQQFGINPSDVKCTGPHGKLLKYDVQQHILEKGLTPAKGGAGVAAVQAPQPKARSKGVGKASGYVDVEVTNMRRTIAKRLTQSKSSIPHAYATMECVLDPVITTREEMKSAGSKVSVNDFVIKAVGQALVMCPGMNAVWAGDKVTFPGQVDVSVAVATESGLITPIVQDVPSKSLEQVSSTVKELAKKARDGKLQPHEFQGGTFTISNLGMFGVSRFSAIINPPQCGILAVGTGRQVLSQSGQVQTRMTATLSYDGGALSEETAARFMETLKTVMENPGHMMAAPALRRMQAL